MTVTNNVTAWMRVLESLLSLERGNVHLCMWIYMFMYLQKLFMISISPAGTEGRLDFYSQFS